MRKYVFSAEHAVERFLSEDGGKTDLLANHNGDMALATEFFENEADLAVYTEEYPDAATVDIADAVNTGAVSKEFFLKLAEGTARLEKESLLHTQAVALTKQVEGRPLFKDVVQDKLILVH